MTTSRVPTIVLFSLFVCFSHLLSAQTPSGFSNLRTRFLSAHRSVQTIDSLTVVVPLLAVSDSATGQMFDLKLFAVENKILRTDTARLRAACPNCGVLRVTYRVLPFDLSAPVSRLDTAAIRRAQSGEPDIAFDYSPYQPASKPWETGGLVSNGAYTRGLSFGNSQNLVFNSNLNLQLNGKLGNDLELQAALSDNSVPLQPDGTTRQLQEFDRIFIQLKRKNTVLTAGDFDLTRPAGYFSNYFKRLQGAMVSYAPAAPPGPPMRGGEGSAPGISGLGDGKNVSTSPNVSNSSEDGKNTVPFPNTAAQSSSSPPLMGGLGGALGTSVRVAAAVSRGKFSRQTIQGQEGNQGPYRLQGAEGERFIIVLAGTEKVFVDGQLMRRGLQDDYTVDYNLGEVTFTARRLVTKDSRIIVEFEYAVQTYLRSTMAANLGWNTRRVRTFFNFYSEQDSRNNSSAGELSPVERLRLAESGDNLRNAYASGIDTLADFDPSRVLYQYADTVACGVAVRILVYSTNSKTARYAARFSEVTQGQGNYVQALTAANGRVFRWSPPDPVTCQPTGNFEPIVRLIAPELRQLWTVGAEAQPFKGGQIQAEAAMSNRDLNRFSPLGNEDDLGGAGFISFRQQLWGSPRSTVNSQQSKVNGQQSTVNAQLYGNYEYASRQFRPLNPYRPAEFVRDWNTGSVLDTATEQIARAGMIAQRVGWGTGRYEFGTYQRQGSYDGIRHFGQLRFQRRGWEAFGEANFLQTNGNIENTRFSRPKAEISKTIFQKKISVPDATAPPDTSRNSVPAYLAQPFFKIGLYTERERNERTLANADTLSRSSFWYDLYRFYFQTLDNQRAWQLGGSLVQRNDYFPVGRDFKQNTIANEANINGTWQFSGRSQRPKDKAHAKSSATSNFKPPTSNLTWNLTYRTLRVLKPELTDQTSQNTYLGRVDYSLAAWRNALNLTTGYELGSGQSPRVEFNYVQVNPGDGLYTWVDRNRDSILQVDEMEIAVFQDQATYIRVAVTTPDYIRTNNVLFNQNLRLDPRIVWGNSKRRWQRGLSRFSTQSTLQINRRTYAGAEGVSAWNPFQFAVADSALVTVTSTVRNVLFVNRANPDWDASLAQGDNRSQVVLTTGFEQRRNQDRILHGRVSISRRWSTEADVTQGERVSDNQAFDTRDFTIRYWEAGPKLTWLPDRTFRMVFNFNLKNSQNALGEREKADQTEWNSELTWNPQSRQNGQGFRAATSVRLRGTFTDIRYTGQSNTAVAFTMLEGLQDGRNFQWSLTLDRQLSKSVQLNLNYEGRKTGDNRVVHVGRAQVRAVF